MMPDKILSRSAGSSSSIVAWDGRSHISTYIRCLHLLDLDLRSDWPGLSENTFWMKSAQQNSQHRIKAAEWSLYRLFERYAPEDTKDKLRPFFPPLDPLQSLNLRAALLRGLTLLKKNGVLDKGITLRKTMLDECKGEKFEEVLSNFAMVVLRSEVTRHRADDSFYACDRTVFSRSEELCMPLIIAHRKALQTSLQTRVTINAQVNIEQEYFCYSESELSNRSDSLLQVLSSTERDCRLRAREILRDFWSDDQRLTPLFLHGGLPKTHRIPPDVSLQQKEFPNYTQSQSQQALAAAAILNSLDTRLQLQQQRLRKWQNFSESLQLDTSHTQKTGEHHFVTKENAQRFAGHRHMNAENRRYLLEQTHSDSNMLKPQYDELLKSMKADLVEKARLKTSKQRLDHLVTPKSSSESFGVFRTGADHASSRIQTQQIHCGSLRAYDTAPLQDSESDRPLSEHTCQIGSNTDITDKEMQTRFCSSANSQEFPRIDLSMHEKIPVEHEVKHSALTPPEDHSLSSAATTEIKSTNPDFATMMFQNSETINHSPVDVLNNRNVASLAERTRDSMATSDSGQHRATSKRKSRGRRSTQLFPINQFETPRSTKTLQMQTPDAMDTTPREKLFEEEANYDSVFKSRPRIALSPVQGLDDSTLDINSVGNDSSSEDYQ